jgi:hypothetical protein
MQYLKLDLTRALAVLLKIKSLTSASGGFFK